MNRGFSALQRAEIAEINRGVIFRFRSMGFSALQRAEIAEIFFDRLQFGVFDSFSALQRAEIAEIVGAWFGERRRKRKFQCSSTSRNC